MEKQFAHLVQEAEKMMESQKSDLNKNMSLLMSDESETPENKEYMKGLVERMNKSIEKGDTADLLALKDELVNKIKKQ
jgi:dsDNA-specific endonuclease/ATPase MutS2